MDLHSTNEIRRYLDLVLTHRTRKQRASKWVAHHSSTTDVETRFESMWLELVHPARYGLTEPPNRKGTRNVLEPVLVVFSISPEFGKIGVKCFY